jgi:hypothetical protein
MAQEPRRYLSTAILTSRVVFGPTLLIVGVVLLLESNNGRIAGVHLMRGWDRGPRRSAARRNLGRRPGNHRSGDPTYPAAALGRRQIVQHGRIRGLGGKMPPHTPSKR